MSSPAASLSPPFVLLLLLIACFHRSAAARSEVFDSSGYYGGNESPCPVPDDANKTCPPVKCFRYDPVCGQNGVTYGCGCADAACAGVRVVKSGPCQVGNGGTTLFSGQAFFLIHILWLFVLGFSVFCDFF